MKKFLLSVETMFVVEAADENEAYAKASECMPEDKYLDFIIEKEIEMDEEF